MYAKLSSVVSKDQGPLAYQTLKQLIEVVNKDRDRRRKLEEIRRRNQRA